MNNQNPILRALDKAITAIGRGPTIYQGANHRDVRNDVPLSREATAELTPKFAKRPPPSKLENVPFPSMEQDRAFRAEVKARGFKVSPEIVTQLDELEEPHARLLNARSSYTDRLAREQHREHLVSIAQRVAKGDHSHEAEDAWSVDQWLEDFQLRRKAFGREMNDLEQKAAAIAVPALRAYGEALNQWADELEEPIASQAAALHCTHNPPPYIWIIRKAAQAANDPGNHPTGRPKLMLGPLVE